MKRDEALRYANEAGLTSMLETPRMPYTDWVNRILRLVELVEQHNVGAADDGDFYGLPYDSVSSSNAGGKCVTAGETAPTWVGITDEEIEKLAIDAGIVTWVKRVYDTVDKKFYDLPLGEGMQGDSICLKQFAHLICTKLKENNA